MDFYERLKNMSLLRQLALMTLSIITAFTFLLFGFLNASIDSYARNQIFELMKSSQDEVLYMYESGLQDTQEFNKRIPNNMEHIILSKTKKQNHFGTSYFATAVLDEALKHLDKFETEYQIVLRVDGVQYYYCMQKTPEGLTIITIADSGFSQIMRNSLLNRVVDVMFIVMVLMLMVLLTWMGNIIYPINQIKSYIDKLRVGIPAELNINRKDEIGLLAESLVAMNRELEKQEKAKVEMLHNISHDFKTPLSTIKSYAESIKDGVYPYDTLEKSVDVIYDNADRLEKKVQSLLLLNRFSYVLEESAETEEIAMSEIINKTILGAKVIRPDINIEVELEDVYFLGNQESWTVVVENIIDNALRYAKSVIRIELKDEGGLYIKNDGPLLDEKNINNFFKPYEKGSDGQFGLGLSIVKRACNVYGYEAIGYNEEAMVVFRIYPKIAKTLPKQKAKTNRSLNLGNRSKTKNSEGDKNEDLG